MSKKVESLLDAFLALKDIDDEEVVSMIKPKKIKESLQEGISVPLNSTQEDFEEAREYLNKPEDEVELEVIDADADSIEHLKDKKDYVGQALLQCIRCRATRFIEMDKLEASEDDDEIYNKEDECPHCKAEGFGFELVGQVGKVENNNEPLTDEDEAKIENDEVDDEEVKFDNDQTEDEETEEDTEEETELEELPELEDEKEINGDETNSHEDDDLLELPKLGDEVEEKEVEEDDEDVQESLVKPYNTDLNKYAQKAWMLNKVIRAMNDQEAYYGSWLYIWPDGETKLDCQNDFGDKQSYNELEREFERVYKKYHEDGLYNASHDVLEMAHEMDSQFDLKPIENLKQVEEVLQDKEEADEDYKPVVSDLLDSVINQDNIKFVVVNGQEVEGLDEDLEAAEFESFNVGEGYLTANIDSEDKESEDKLSILLDYFNDEETEKIKLVDVQSSEEVFEGTKADAIEKFGDCKFVSFDAPERLELTVKDFKPTNVKDEEKDEEAELVEAICKANGYASYRINNPRTNEYWINESVRSGDDLKTIYTLFVEGLGKELVEQFKRVTGYKTELDIVNEKYGVKNEGKKEEPEWELAHKLGIHTLSQMWDYIRKNNIHADANWETLIASLKADVKRRNNSIRNKRQSDCPRVGDVLTKEKFKEKIDSHELPHRPTTIVLGWSNLGRDDISFSDGTPYSYSDYQLCIDNEPFTHKATSAVRFNESIRGKYTIMINHYSKKHAREEGETYGFANYDDLWNYVKDLRLHDIIKNDPNKITIKAENEALKVNENLTPEQKKSLAGIRRFAKEQGYSTNNLGTNLEEAEDPSTYGIEFLGPIELLLLVEENGIISDYESVIGDYWNTAEEFIDSYKEATKVNEENEVAVVEPRHEVAEMPEEEKEFLNNLGRVANDICDAITKYYGIETDPSLVVADIMQDLSLIAGTLKPEDLEDSPINNLTKEMFNDYNAMEDFVSDLSVMFGGQPLDKTPEARIGRAIRTLEGPGFSTENIFRNIGSNRFIDMANAGQVGFLTGDQVLQLGEACHKKVKEACKSFKTRKELSEAIQECKNNNWPYRVRRSENEEFRYDLITEEYEDVDLEDNDFDGLEDVEIFTVIIQNEHNGEEKSRMFDNREEAIKFYNDKAAELKKKEIGWLTVKFFGDNESYIYNWSEDEVNPEYRTYETTAVITEAKKDDVELPVDSDAVKAEVHDSIADLVKDEVEAIQGYDEVKAQVADSHIEHADDINNTLEHIKDEEQEHIDELNDLSELIPFEKEGNEEVIEQPVEEFPVDEEFGFVEDFLDKEDDLFDEVRFDKEMNDYFKENYSEDVTYKTTKGSIDDNGVIVLEGIVKTTDSRSAITFTLTPSKEINEAFQDVEKEEILGGTTIYQVTNDLSDEVMSFSEYKEDFQRDQEFVNKIIDKWIKETKIENLCPCMLDDIAAWEFENHKAAYKQKGMDESHIKNILVSHIPE